MPPKTVRQAAKDREPLDGTDAQALEGALAMTERELNAAVSLLQSIRDNWDCDSDAHKYHTPCRVCDCALLLTKLRR